MEEGCIKREAMPQLLDLIPDEKQWKLRGAPAALGRSRNTGFGVDEDKKLELKLGLPGLLEEETAATSSKNMIRQESPALSLGYLPKHSMNVANTATTTGAKRGFLDTVEAAAQGYDKEQKQQARAACGKELAAEENTAAVSERKKGCCPPPPSHAPPATPAHNSPQARGRAAVPVVGWPPIRDIRKKLASSSVPKKLPEPQNGEAEAKAGLSCKNSPLVKINMDGIPIGRKFNLAACDSYERLSVAVKGLFHGFIEAQREASNAERAEQGVDEKIFSQLLDGSGEYTLVYEDNEGDRMLVGDVPWNVFVSTAKRLRVLRSSELSRGLSGAVPKRAANC
ncbi:unnamed protein product [Alopecurus aequalis]